MPLDDTVKLESTITSGDLAKNTEAQIHVNIFPWVKKLWYAMAVAKQYGVLSHFCGKDRPGEMTMGDLRQRNLDQVKTLVRQAWQVVLESVDNARIVPVSKTFDPSAEDKYALLSSKNHKQAFHKFKVAFRGDSRGPADVLANGLQGKWKLPTNLMNNLFNYLPNYNEYIDDTIAVEHMAFNKANHDFQNETGVCVSRALKGATKFPHPSDTNVNYIYAVRVAKCLDTEAWQRKQGGTKPWRPGEKAVAEIPVSQILAHTSFRRSDYREGAEAKDDLWFKYEILENWNLTSRIMSDERSYIAGELEGMKGVKQDFLRGEDFTVP